MRSTKTILCWLPMLWCVPLHAQWQWVNINSGDNLNHISFNADSVAILTSPHALLVTHDLGNSWDTLYYIPNHYMGDVQFYNDSTLFLDVYPNSGNGFLAKSFDSGNTWTNATMSTGKFHFVSPTMGFTSVPFFVNTTADGGNTWGNPIMAGSGAIGNIYFVTDSIGYIAANYPGAVSVTTNAGTTWQTQAAIEGSDVFAPSVTTAYAVGWFGQIQKTINTGVTWTTLNTGVGNQVQLRSVYCTNDNTCYAVGDNGTIIKTSDGGNTWQHQYSGTQQALHSVWCLNENTCFAVGDSGTVLRTTNGGVGMPEIKVEGIKMYPNPSDGTFTIDLENNETVYLQVYNSSGEIVFENPRFFAKQLVLDKLGNGLYYIHAIRVNGSKLTQRVLIVK